MSLGVGIGDVVLVSSLAWTLYKACKESNDEFKQIALELQSLHAVLRETEDYMQEHDNLDTSRLNRLQILCDGCKPILEELERLVNKYDSLGTQAQRKWDVMRFGMEDITALRSRLVSSTTMLNAFNVALINSSTMRIEKRLQKFMAEVQAGLREGSIVTVDNAVDNIESPEGWQEFRRELEDIGISPAVVEDNREYIARWIRDALAEGLLEESPAQSEASRKESVVSDFSNSSRGERIETSVSSESEAPDTNDSRKQSNLANNERGPSTITSNGRRPSTLALSAATKEFHRQISQDRRSNGSTPTSSIDATAAASATRRPSAGNRIRLAMDVPRFLKRIVVKDKTLIQAASDGNIEQVAQLLDLGVNVDVKESWGWSALSMCAYGGHKEIARLLLDHGADLDNLDVDGDTPTSIAASRGHTDLVVMFDEERAMRDLLIREAD